MCALVQVRYYNSRQIKVKLDAPKPARKIAARCRALAAVKVECGGEKRR
jgi:hypothetical protein